ncbi:hypothetical protein ANN_11428 [Periplaneta americana]|uniref:Reverse transcriptase domain-containing protein n=1 Tax=Periplaneta americana TaxID=6978 RepID=A0ABQ8T6P1_PERAM|nr:hypothetical protein ANN_11428 [Periplaneta americana]
MAGLCEGGNEPPGSLKASKSSCRKYGDVCPAPASASLICDVKEVQWRCSVDVNCQKLILNNRKEDGIRISSPPKKNRQKSISLKILKLFAYYMDKHIMETGSNARPVKYEACARVRETDNYECNYYELHILNKGYKFNYPPHNLDNTIDNLVIETEHVIQNCEHNCKDYLRYHTSKIIQNYQNDPNPKRQFKEAKLTHQKVTALGKKLKSNNLIHTKADKGNAVVIMEKPDYVNKTYEFIAKNNVEEINSNPIDKLQKSIKSAIKSAPDIINEKDAHKYIAKNPSLPTLKALPKTHKKDLSMRPVVNSVNTPNHKINTFLLKYLKQILKMDNRYSLNNSQQLIERLQRLSINKSTKLVSLDIENLYTNIPLDETLKIISEKLHKLNTDEKIINQLMQLLSVCTKQNYFRFDNKYFLQTRGVAMGDSLSGFFGRRISTELGRQTSKNLLLNITSFLTTDMLTTPC